MGKGLYLQDKAADYCSGGDEKRQTPRSDPDNGMELMIFRKAGFSWVILCPAKPPLALASQKGGRNAVFFSHGRNLPPQSREQVLQLSPTPGSSSGAHGLGSNLGTVI